MSQVREENLHAIAIANHQVETHEDNTVRIAVIDGLERKERPLIVLVNVMRKFVADFKRLGFAFSGATLDDFNFIIGNFREYFLRSIREEYGPKCIVLFDDFADGVFDFCNGILRIDFEIIVGVVFAEFKMVVASV